jgi:hypothetical protein
MLCCASRQNAAPIVCSGSKPAVTALQHGRLLHLD